MSHTDYSLSIAESKHDSGVPGLLGVGESFVASCGLPCLHWCPTDKMQSDLDNGDWKAELSSSHVSSLSRSATEHFIFTRTQWIFNTVHLSSHLMCMHCWWKHSKVHVQIKSNGVEYMCQPEQHTSTTMCNFNSHTLKKWLHSRALIIQKNCRNT